MYQRAFINAALGISTLFCKRPPKTKLSRSQEKETTPETICCDARVKGRKSSFSTSALRLLSFTSLEEVCCYYGNYLMMKQDFLRSARGRKILVQPHQEEKNLENL